MRLFANFCQLFRKCVNLLTMGKGKILEVNKASISGCIMDSRFCMLRKDVDNIVLYLGCPSVCGWYGGSDWPTAANVPLTLFPLA